jgi:putative resolvase
MERRYPIGQAADTLGVTVKTMQRWDREGKLVPDSRSGSNRRLYSESQLAEYAGIVRQSATPQKDVAYCRVSSHAQRADLVNQRKVLEEFIVGKGFANVEFIEEVGGGLNFKRPKFLKLMDAIGRDEIRRLVVAHTDRLARFGFDWFAHYAKTHGCEILVLNQERLSPEQEMVQDLVTITHCFSSRLCGLRSYKPQLKKALDEDRA